MPSHSCRYTLRQWLFQPNVLCRFLLRAVLTSLPIISYSILNFNFALAAPFDPKLPELPQVQPKQPLSRRSNDEQVNLAAIPPANNVSAKTYDSRNAVLDAIDVMQSSYFVLLEGSWPSANDWTAAVMATQITSTLSILTSAMVCHSEEDACQRPFEDIHEFENLINHYFDHTTAFYFGEHALSLKFQAYDDMLWVVLEWLEAVKFAQLHSWLHYSSENELTAHKAGVPRFSSHSWHGTQYQTQAGHRARAFYETASNGWDTSLCGGGMIWSPHLTPYKNAITNELYISASVAMYLYYPGDNIDFPIARTREAGHSRDPKYLSNAITAYQWLNASGMRKPDGLYGDGFHIKKWRKNNPGTRKCDEFDSMVYTYNQGVILSAQKGLFLSTGDVKYLRDGHELVASVTKATGWPSERDDQQWKGLGRGGVLEDHCDSQARCSQDGQTFKGIFFHHFTEFCRPLRFFEEDVLFGEDLSDADAQHRRDLLHRHITKCASYRPWIEHNARAALMTKNEQGKFGMWWGRLYPDSTRYSGSVLSSLPPGVEDHVNPDFAAQMTRPLGGSNGTNITKNPNDVSIAGPKDANDRGRGRTVETQAGGLAVIRALFLYDNDASFGRAEHQTGEGFSDLDLDHDHEPEDAE